MLHGPIGATETTAIEKEGKIALLAGARDPHMQARARRPPYVTEARTIAPCAEHKLGHAARRARRADGRLRGATSPGGVPVVLVPQQSGPRSEANSRARTRLEQVKFLATIPDWFAGQPLVYYDLLAGAEAGMIQFQYVAEQITDITPPGTIFQQGRRWLAMPRS